MKALLWLAAVVALSGCQPPLAEAVRTAEAEVGPSPVLLAAVVVHADDARRTAFASADPKPLEPYFGGRALLRLRLQVARLAGHGVHRIEVLDSRRVVHQGGAPGLPEVVLEIRARQQDGSAWSTVLRQWRAQLGRQGGSWLVMEEGDLPPVAWWR